MADAHRCALPLRAGAGLTEIAAGSPGVYDIPEDEYPADHSTQGRRPDSHRKETIMQTIIIEARHIVTAILILAAGIGLGMPVAWAIDRALFEMEYAE